MRTPAFCAVPLSRTRLTALRARRLQARLQQNLMFLAAIADKSNAAPAAAAPR